MTARLLVIQHEDACPPDWFGEWLVEEGVELDVVEAHHGDDVPVQLNGHDGLLVLGGEMGANDDATVPWLAATKDLIAKVVAEHEPFLGICLGHQLATVALGGEVARNPNGHAKGLTPIGLTAAGRTDELLGDRDGLPAVQWNGDVAVRLPAHAVELATSPDGTPQAVRFGERAWGVQFHPEASPETFRRWTVDKPSASDKAIAAAAAIDAAADDLRDAWAPLARRFAALVRG